MENVRHAVEQICLISEQPAPNYIGAVCIPKKLKKAHFLVTHRMERRAEQLAAIMKKNGIRVEIYMLSDTDPESVFSLLERIPLQKDSTVAVNVTGGTKVMSLTALEWANMCGHIPFYVDTEKSRILILQNRFTAYEYSARLKVRDILQLQGFYFGRRKPPRIEPVRQREILHKIAEYCIANPESLRLVNDTLSSSSPSWRPRFPRRSPPVPLDLTYKGIKNRAAVFKVAVKAALHVQLDLTYKGMKRSMTHQGSCEDFFCRS